MIPSMDVEILLYSKW